MKIVTNLVILITILSCTNKNKNNENSILKYNPTKSHDYPKIIENLNHCQYVPLYRCFQEMNANLDEFHINTNNDSIFKADSIYYTNAREKFFAQDVNLLKWLLHFENDTSKTSLWKPFQSPYSSTIIFDCPKSESALNLILSFLDGQSIYCFNCKLNDDPCFKEKYKEIKCFLIKNKKLSVIQLRKKWEKKNNSKK